MHLQQKEKEKKTEVLKVPILHRCRNRMHRRIAIMKMKRRKYSYVRGLEKLWNRLQDSRDEHTTNYSTDLTLWQIYDNDHL